VASVFDLMLANYSIDRGFGGSHVAKSYDENVPYTPAWAEKITGARRDQIIQVAREFAHNAEKTKGRSMVIIGAAMNHWYHADMNYRGVINMLVMCGCIGQSGGGWSHYVGQEKLRPQSGWLPLAFALDWTRPPRQQNSTSFFYAHTDQWRYETLDTSEIVSPTAPSGRWDGALIDYNVRAERMGWLPSAPHTSDMHPFIHPLTGAVDPVWEARSDWEIYKAIAKKFSEVAPEVLGLEKDFVLTPILHDTPAEMAQALDVKDWKRGECEPLPGKTMPAVAVIERDYPNLYKRFTALGPLMCKLGNGGKGMAWNTAHEVDFLKRLNGVVNDEGPTKGLARIESDIDAAEVILTLAPETNGEVAVKAWEALGKTTGRDHRHLALPKQDEKIRFRDVVSQPRKIISSPVWSGLESEKVCYNAGYTNVHELIPWRTLTGRQQLYQDHLWMRAFGEALCVYRPPIDTRSVKPVIDSRPNGARQVVLNFITPHQKWGIHSTYTDNLLMLTLSRGGPIVWISEEDAAKAGIVDNDWIEAYNANGALVARAVVSQRVKQGMCLMYHAQEKIVNVPGSEITGQRGGIHNSVTRAVVKPTHMIGGYVQLSYGFNYYGTIGTNRDEFVIVRKMARVDWLDRPACEPPQALSNAPKMEAAK